MLNEQPRTQLRTMLIQYGQSVCQDAKRCEALLRDFCPEHKRELNLLIAALKEGIPQQLLIPSSHISIEFTIKRLAQTLHDNLGIAESFAFWAVESWALSLNVLTQPIAQTQQPQLPTPKQTPTPQIIKPQTASLSAQWRDPITGMEFVKIPKGIFMMGSPDNEPDRCDNEKLHRVDIAHDFYLSKTLVTQAQWQAVMGDNPSHFKGNDLPVEQVSWLDIQRFIAQLNHKTGQQYRLPTEVEWEYACRAGTSTPFYTGHVLTAKEANFNHFLFGKTSVVGSYPPNPWGLYDIAGNVWEWTASVYDTDYKFSEQVSNNNDANSQRVFRGGSWLNKQNYVRSANRLNLSPDYRDNNIGFRLSRM
ncbi:MAG: formylglycine-generating enzyme family protein [Methylococcaceae bacterium]|nr:formylglycine-generating enzyme family protein [Methylococcaceae bacterium]